MQAERILVVEDSPTQAQYLRLVLEDEGYEVEIAANGLIALRIVRTSPPDLVLSDIVMPEMDGHELCQAMKADITTRAIPLVMLSSLQAQLDRARALENGADDFLNKPIDADELLTRVRSLVRLKTLTDRLVELDRSDPRRVLLAVTPGTEWGRLLETLQSGGYVLDVAHDGREVDDAVHDVPPDLVIADVELPAFDAYRFCQDLKADEATKRIPVVMITAANDRDGRARALEAGADDFLARPIDQSELLTRARSLLRLKGLYDRLAESDNEIARQAAELAATNSALMKLTAELEERVAARTAELEAKTEEVQSMSQQLWQTAKLATMGELAASIAHELNNPLATVSLRIESMLYSANTDDPNRRALEIVDGEVDRMAKLVARLLEFSRRGEQQVTTVDIPSEVGSALELVQNYLRNRRVQPVVEFGDGRLMVHADRQQLRQVMLNLITNGCDAMPDGGTLTIRVTRVRNDDAEADASAAEQAVGEVRNGCSIVIDISDTGTGIPTEVLPHILEPFFTTKPEGKGTGLGLAICRRIVQEHNGTIEIESTAGAGTTIRIVLPASDNGDPSNAH